MNLPIHLENLSVKPSRPVCAATPPTCQLLVWLTLPPQTMHWSWKISRFDPIAFSSQFPLRIGGYSLGLDSLFGKMLS
eukprot:m.248141 g.248141  ORF g.248141 m.248141 type:complete len:78 (-) comp54482_c0_seq4:436-669(-)